MAVDRQFFTREDLLRSRRIVAARNLKEATDKLEQEAGASLDQVHKSLRSQPRFVLLEEALSEFRQRRRESAAIEEEYMVSIGAAPRGKINHEGESP